MELHQKVLVQEHINSYMVSNQHPFHADLASDPAFNKVAIPDPGF